MMISDWLTIQKHLRNFYTDNAWLLNSFTNPMPCHLAEQAKHKTTKKNISLSSQNNNIE